jgi:uncharacterized membrane protein
MSIHDFLMILVTILCFGGIAYIITYLVKGGKWGITQFVEWLHGDGWLIIILSIPDAVLLAILLLVLFGIMPNMPAHNGHPAQYINIFKP